MVTAQLDYVHNVRVPGMLHGRVVRPPSVGATLARVDEASVRGMPGAGARRRARRTSSAWSPRSRSRRRRSPRSSRCRGRRGRRCRRRRTYYEHLRRDARRATRYLLDSGDVDQTLRGARTVVAATYRHPFHMHGSVGSSCAVADVQPGKATLWSATQAVYPMRDTAARLLGLPAEQVRVVFTRGSGCYGINGADTVTYDAALLSQAVGRPVRVQLTRRDEMAWENFGNAFVIDQRAGLDASGTIVAWDYEAWSPALGGRPGYDSPGNVVTGWLAGFAPAAAAPRTPAPAPTTPLNNNLNTAPSYVTGCVGRRLQRHRHGAQRARAVAPRASRRSSPARCARPSGSRTRSRTNRSWTRSPRRPRPIPVAFRAAAPARRAAAHGRAPGRGAPRQWEARPSPRTGTAADRRAHAAAASRACSTRATTATWRSSPRSSVDQATGVDRACTRLVGAQDCGPISNPDGVRNQFEGGALHGMSRALFEEVTWNDQAVTSVDWRGYRTFAVGTRTPAVETVLVNQPVRAKPTAPARRPSPWWPRPSATPCSTPPAPGCARFRSRPRARESRARRARGTA